MNLPKKLTQRRINRITYITGSLLSFILILAYILIPARYFLQTLHSDALAFLSFAPIVAVYIIYSNVLRIRRFHDLKLDNDDLFEYYKDKKGRKGFVDWYYGGIFSFTEKGQQGSNKYGPQPKPGVDWKSLLLLK